MSTLNRLLVFEVKEPEIDFEGMLPVQQLSISHMSPHLQLDRQVVKVSGTITVSF